MTATTLYSIEEVLSKLPRPMCSTCKKPVERVVRVNDLLNDSIAFRYYCHGQGEQRSVALSELRAAQVPEALLINQLYVNLFAPERTEQLRKEREAEMEAERQRQAAMLAERQRQRAAKQSIAGFAAWMPEYDRREVAGVFKTEPMPPPDPGRTVAPRRLLYWLERDRMLAARRDAAKRDLEAKMAARDFWTEATPANAVKIPPPSPEPDPTVRPRRRFDFGKEE